MKETMKINLIVVIVVGRGSGVGGCWCWVGYIWWVGVFHIYTDGKGGCWFGLPAKLC